MVEMRNIHPESLTEKNKNIYIDVWLPETKFDGSVLEILNEKNICA